MTVDELKIIEESGLSKNQAKVYLALLELGCSSATSIIDKSKLHRANVYDALDQLAKKTLVTHITQNDVRMFQANSPEILMNVIKEKEIKLNSIMPQLKLKNEFAQSKTQVKTYDGLKGIKEVLYKSIEKMPNGGDLYVFGIPKKVPDLVKSFIMAFHRDQAEHSITMYHLYNENAKERIAFLESLPFTRAKYLPKEYDSPASTVVFENCVGFLIWNDDPMAVLIEDKRMAESYKKYFKLLWKIAANEDLETK